MTSFCARIKKKLITKMDDVDKESTVYKDATINSLLTPLVQTW